MPALLITLGTFLEIPVFKWKRNVGNQHNLFGYGKRRVPACCLSWEKQLGNLRWADGGYTITLSGTIECDSITFLNSGYTITGGTSLVGSARVLTGTKFVRQGIRVMNTIKRRTTMQVLISTPRPQTARIPD